MPESSSSSPSLNIHFHSCKLTAGVAARWLSELPNLNPSPDTSRDTSRSYLKLNFHFNDISTKPLQLGKKNYCI